MATTLLWAPVAGAQSRGLGTVRGVVFDSTTSGPLVDAAVFLWETVHRGVSDEKGRFVIADVPEGRYSALFFHTKLGVLGVSPGARPVEVRAGEVTEVHLAIPSHYTLLAMSCLLEGAAGDRSTGALVGRVLDAESEVPYEGATVRVDWPASGAGADGRIEISGAGGWFSACDVPAGVPIGVSAAFLGRSALHRELELAEGETLPLDLRLARRATSVLRGRIADAETGDRVSDAEVRLIGTRHVGTTDANGIFRLEDVPPGDYTLSIGHLAYGDRTEPLHVAPDAETSILVEVSPRAIDLDPIQVTVESEPLTERAMGGLLISRSDIDRVRVRARDAAAILREQRVPGLLIVREGPRACFGFSQGQVRMRVSSCEPAMVFIDNVRQQSPMDALMLPEGAIDRMVLYRPIEAGNLFPLGSSAGVLMIYTRRR